jgi:hypothetical protein
MVDSFDTDPEAPHFVLSPKASKIGIFGPEFISEGDSFGRLTRSRGIDSERGNGVARILLPIGQSCSLLWRPEKKLERVAFDHRQLRVVGQDRRCRGVLPDHVPSRCLHVGSCLRAEHLDSDVLRDQGLLASYTQSLRYQLKDTRIQVLELIPPYVQTTMLGPSQATDPHAMPLDAFITETMKILTTHPDRTELCVERVLELRNPAYGGPEAYEKIFQGYNDAITHVHA